MMELHNGLNAPDMNTNAEQKMILLGITQLLTMLPRIYTCSQASRSARNQSKKHCLASEELAAAIVVKHR
jgi:hypothetical protein